MTKQQLTKNNINIKDINIKLGAFLSADCDAFGVRNQSILYFEHGKVFQSYQSLIAYELDNEPTIYLGKDWDYSTTTSKYRNMFLGNTTKEVKEHLKNGTYQLINK